jgi:LysM repeat protein
VRTSDVRSIGPIGSRRPSRLSTRGALRQVQPPGATLNFQADPEQLARATGAGGWERRQRPKRTDALEWTGTPLASFPLELVFDGWPDKLVEEPCRILEVWGKRQPGWHQPATLQLLYGANSGRLYVVDALDWGEELRSSDGLRVRQQVTVTLLEYAEGDVVLTPAQTVAAVPAAPGAPPKPSGRTYTVKAGDSFSRIAQQQLGQTSRWPEIPRLNGLPLAAIIFPGQVLRLP